jgi:hypothetical protein
MGQLIKSLLENCEIAAKRDASGWHISAKGGLAMGVVILLVLVWAFR